MLYLDSSGAYGDGGKDALQNALELFLQHPEIGFVWLAYDNTKPVSVSVGITFILSALIRP